MGEIIEMPTYAHHPKKVFKMSSSILGFEVKAANAAMIGLTTEPGIPCDYWVSIGNGGRIWIKGPEGLRGSSGGNYALIVNQYRKFWIAWDYGNLRLGVGKSTTPVISYPHSKRGLNYITFTTHETVPAVWKFQLPPPCLLNLENNIPSKQIQGGDIQWKAAGDALPDDAVIGGYESECLYIVRANQSNSLTPGKFVPSEGLAYIPWGGESNPTEEFEVLCGYNFKWESTTDDKIPGNAFVAGYSEVNQEELYIGRVYHMDCVIPGKVQATHKVCYVPYSDREQSFKEYEILTIPDLNPHIAKHYLDTNPPPLIRHDNGYDNDFVNRVVILDDDDDISDEDGGYVLHGDWWGPRGN